MSYRQRVLKTAERIARAGFPCTAVHTGDLSLMDSTIEITGTNLAVQVCLHGDYALSKAEEEGVYFTDCPTLLEVITRLKKLTTA